MTGNAAGSLIQLDADFMADPHPTYRRLRRERPVTQVRMPPGLRAWLVTRYDDVRAALVDPRLAKDSAGLVAAFDRQVHEPVQRARWASQLTAHMLNSDPPQHTRLRKLVSRGFTGRAIERLRPRIEALADELAGGLARDLNERGTVDLIDRFAFPLPMTVICEILGVPRERRAEFRTWSNTMLSTAPVERRAEAGSAMAEYLVDLIAEKRAHPAGDMLSAIVAASEDADQLSEAEAVSMAFLLLVAGHETTVNLIGNGMLALLREPERAAALRADPALLPGAVEEFLRLHSPVNLATMRFTAAATTIGGTTIPEGEVVLLALGAANRDPERYSSPDELDILRDPAHLAFGHGIHFCLGAALARLEGVTAFRTLLDRFPTLTLATENLSWRQSTIMRGLTALPVRLASAQ